MRTSRAVFLLAAALAFSACGLFDADEEPRLIAFLSSDAAPPSEAGYTDKLAVVDLERGVVRPLTGPGAWTWEYALSADGRTLLWFETSEQGAALVAANWKGEHRVRLLETAGYDVGVRLLAPDGRLAAFSRDAGRLYVVGRDGTGLRRLEAAGERVTLAAFSPDGRNLLFHRVRADAPEENASYFSDLFVIGADGQRLVRLTDDRLWKQFTAYSPDGRYVLYTRAVSEEEPYASDLFVVGPDGSNVRRLTDDGVQKLFPRFSPDGRTIAYVAAGAAGQSVHAIGVDGGGPRVLADEGAYYGELVFSPDGSKLLTEASAPFGAGKGPASAGCAGVLCFSRDVVEIDLAGGTRRLTSDLMDDGDPVYSPDGRQIAFWRRFSNGSGDVFVMDSDGSRLRNVTRDSTSFARRPVFVGR